MLPVSESSLPLLTLEKQRQGREKKRFLESISLIVLIVSIIGTLFYLNTILNSSRLDYLGNLGLLCVIGLSSLAGFLFARANRLIPASIFILGGLSVGNSLLFLISTSWVYIINIICFLIISLIALITINSLVAYLVTGLSAILLTITWSLDMNFVSRNKGDTGHIMGFDDLSMLIIVLFVCIWLADYLAGTLKRNNGVLEEQADKLSLALQQLEARQAILEKTGQTVLEMSAELQIIAEKQASNSLEQLSNLHRISSSVTQLASSAGQISDYTRRVDETAELMAQKIQEVETVSHQSANQSEKGMLAVTQTIEACRVVNDLYNELQKSLQELNERSARSGKILELLETLSGEIHLLALNATIEAAGAGKYGERFAVIAQEVRALANRTSKSNREAAKVVQEIEDASQNARQMVNLGSQKAGEMEKVAGEAGDVIGQMRKISEKAQQEAFLINGLSGKVKDSSKEIKVSTIQQHSSSEEVLASLKSLVEMARLNAAGSENLSATITQLKAISSSIQQ